MSNFQGYLLKFADKIFPLPLLAYDNCQTTPNQRTEIDAWTDGNNLLHRDTYGKTRSKMEYQTLDEITLEQKMEIQEVMRAGLLIEKERKYRVTYWNDETNDYTTGDFYVPDITYKQKSIDLRRNTIIYGPIRIAMIEY